MNNISCSEHIEQFGPAYRLVYYTNPVNNTDNVTAEFNVWLPASPAWTISLLVSIGLRIPFYLLLALVSMALLVDRGNGARFQTKSFPVVYTCVAVLGVSRALFLLLDPFGISGWIADRWPYWVIVSRLLAAAGVPALTTCYTLIFLTLWKCRVTDPSQHWYNKWKIVLSIAAFYFSIAFIAEIVTNSAPFPAISVLIICKAFFTLWGITMCVIYMIAGVQLIRTIKRKVLRSSKVSATDVEKNKIEYNKRLPARAIRKIMYVSYGTAILGILYSIVNAGLLGMKIYTVIVCFGLHGQSNPTLWLFFEISSKILEITLAFNILYSVTNTNKIMKAFKRLIKTSCCITQTCS